ncbi:MAG: hypothetical protein FJX30_05330 [Alphaproteobacteria bacterium]|nr:hypothetical protein [Alphaproteobacteria bacterium]
MFSRFLSKTLFGLVFLLIFTTNSLAQNSDFSQIVSEKLIKIATSSNKITKKDYNDFWDSTGIKSSQEKIKLISLMKSNFIAIQQYNSILWECAEKSWKDGAIADCQKINKNFIEVKKTLYNLLGNEEFKKVDFNFNNVMKVSAKRGGSIAPGAPEEEITLEKIQLAKMTSQVVLQRIEIILQPDFK